MELLRQFSRKRSVFKYLYNHFWDNNILRGFQSGFISWESTVNQLTRLYLYDTFCQALNNGKEVRFVFCDLNRILTMLGNAGVIRKHRAAVISGNLLKWFISYLENIWQCVVTPWVQSEWNYIHAGVPLGSIPGLLLFLLYVNDIVTEFFTLLRMAQVHFLMLKIL